jgi:hypothetical protein
VVSVHTRRADSGISDWLYQANQALRAAGLLTEIDAKEVMLQLCQYYLRLAQAEGAQSEGTKCE